MAAVENSNSLAQTNQQQPPIEEPILSPSHLDGVAYLYGHPLLNSLSPPLHQTIYNALQLNWIQLPLSSVYGSSSTYPPPYTRSPPIDKFLPNIRANPKFVGSSVTMPWKVSIMEHLDDLTEEARQIGACNTIYIRQDPETGRKLLVGTNTDCIGVREALRQATPLSSNPDAFRGKPGLIFGGGGTARSAIYAMRKWIGCSRIYIVNRDAAEIEAILHEDRKRASSSLQQVPIIPIMTPAEVDQLDEYPPVIVSAIPNYPPKSADEIRARAVLERFLSSSSPPNEGRVFLEMCYHPLPWTQIAELASGHGWNIVLGSEALIWQGIEQARLWTGRDIVSVPGLVPKIKDFVAGTIEAKAPAVKTNL
ncbi:hypothetical protein AJ80_02609 [Polytolypa hystricis UAMH7299]|uniref:Shikimate dehydrogenase substrate binding N-terminal domain-containing protein n=1 Tax=Polytolypa hystricis (strain UAMH7299) TaxID=1447883 RepID=A0A2B7YNY7_POLH7|nr:hypothetical protein AJ80_02609 [Polytolypa hystricis UAMH7299]